jgi:long-chain acyl-CoA synthetase
MAPSDSSTARRAPLPRRGSEPRHEAYSAVPRPGTLAAALLTALSRPEGVALQSCGSDAHVTYPELRAAVREVAGGLIAMGIHQGDRVAILGATRPEWAVLDVGALFAGATVVPVYHTSSPEECRHVLGHSGARVVFCEDDEQRAKVASVRRDLPHLEHLLTFADVGGLRESGRAEGDAAIDARVHAARPGDPATIVYTSGTTGPPKGCVLTHANCVAAVGLYRARLELAQDSVVFMFLPLAHVLARVTLWVALDVGGTVAFWSGDPARLLEDLQEASPTHLPSVPRVFEKVHTRALAAAQDGGPLRRRVFDMALALGARARSAERSRPHGPGRALRLAHGAADRLVLERVRALFGPDLRVALSGAAPLSREVLEFFDACGVLILEGWGLTETCAAGTLNTPDVHRFGSVGLPLPATELAIAEDGEVLVRGPSVFAGYHEDETATAEVFAPGRWLRSGDLGHVDEDGFLTITGRKKDLIITSSGKNVAPGLIEAALRESRWISQAVVGGDRRPYLVALLTLDPDEAPALAAELGMDADLPAMAADPRVRARLAAEVDAANARFARIEQVKRFAILDHDLSQAAGELTPTMKVKRAVVEDRYGELFDGLYVTA